MIKNIPSILKIDNIDDFSKITQTSQTVNLFVFSAPWSGTCHMLLESLKENRKLLSSKINNVYIINFDTNKTLIENFNIESVPMSLIVNNNEVVHTFSGLFSMEEMKRIID